MSAFIRQLQPFGQETLTVTNAVKQLTSTVYNNTAAIAGGASAQAYVVPLKARGAAVENTSANAIRYTEDGTTPVAATTGSLLNPGDIKFLESYAVIAKFKMIREGGADATVNVTVYR